MEEVPEAVQTEEQVEEQTIRRSPLLACVMSLFVPGLGQMYNGQTRAMVIAMALWLGATNLSGFLVLYVGLPLLIPIVWLIPFWAARNAFAYADGHVIHKLEDYQRPAYYVLIVGLAVSGYFPVFGLPLNLTGVRSYRLPTTSMENTLMVGDYFAVDTRAYSNHKPQVGDVVAFRYPRDPSIMYVKRIAAGPGQSIQVKDGHAYTDGRLVADPPTLKFTNRVRMTPHALERGILAFPDSNWNHDYWGPIKVSEGLYFLLGDNRDNSADSRYWGGVPEKFIIGKARYVYFSWDKSVKSGGIFAPIRWSRIAHRIE